MESLKVVIYCDEGVDAHSFVQVLKGVQEELPFFSLIPIKRDFFVSDDWEHQTAAVIFPGGRDCPYHEALKGEANRRLQDYVFCGGSYFGICAGGYYGASSILFEEGGPLEVKAQRELGFYPGLAKGPAYGGGKFCYESLAGARLASVAWKESVTPIYFNGGCTFEQTQHHSSTEVLATYQDLPGQLPAIVRCQYGQGQAILSGVHPEYGASSFKRSEQIPQKLLRDMLALHDVSRKALWSWLLDLLIKTQFNKETVKI